MTIKRDASDTPPAVQDGSTRDDVFRKKADARLPTNGRTKRTSRKYGPSVIPMFLFLVHFDDLSAENQRH
jgi:hypothetical protein